MKQMPLRFLRGILRLLVLVTAAIGLFAPPKPFRCVSTLRLLIINSSPDSFEEEHNEDAAREWFTQPSHSN